MQSSLTYSMIFFSTKLKFHLVSFWFNIHESQQDSREMGKPILTPLLQFCAIPKHWNWEPVVSKRQLPTTKLRVCTVRKNQGKGEFEERLGKSVNFFHGLEKFVFSRLTQGIHSISRNVLIFQLFDHAGNKDCSSILEGQYFRELLLKCICNVMVSHVRLKYFNEMISKIAKELLNVLY